MKGRDAHTLVNGMSSLLASELGVLAEYSALYPPHPTPRTLPVSSCCDLW